MINIKSRGIKELRELMKRLPRGIKITAMRTAVEFIVGDERHGLKHEPASKFVSRSDAYGKVSDAPSGYFSWAQFYYVAAVTDGFTKSFTRSGDIAGSWTYTESDSNWTSVTVTNTAEGAEFVVGDKQANQPRMVGWRYYMDVVKTNLTGAIKAAQRAVDAWVNRNAK